LASGIGMVRLERMTVMGKSKADDKIELSKEQCKLCLAVLQDWFRKEREEEIGVKTA
jgi:hypothetical protein